MTVNVVVLAAIVTVGGSARGAVGSVETIAIGLIRTRFGEGAPSDTQPALHRLELVRGTRDTVADLLRPICNQI